MHYDANGSYIDDHDHDHDTDHPPPLDALVEKLLGEYRHAIEKCARERGTWKDYQVDLDTLHRMILDRLYTLPVR